VPKDWLKRSAQPSDRISRQQRKKRERAFDLTGARKEGSNQVWVYVYVMSKCTHLRTCSQAKTIRAQKPIPSMETTVAGVQNRRSRSHLLCSRLAAKNRVKKTMAAIATDGENTRNAAKPVAFAPCWIERNSGGPRMARSNATMPLSNALTYPTPCSSKYSRPTFYQGKDRS
jgi:hypothetical protein